MGSPKLGVNMLKKKYRRCAWKQSPKDQWVRIAGLWRLHLRKGWWSRLGAFSSLPPRESLLFNMCPSLWKMASHRLEQLFIAQCYNLTNGKGQLFLRTILSRVKKILRKRWWSRKESSGYILVPKENARASEIYRFMVTATGAGMCSLEKKLFSEKMLVPRPVANFQLVKSLSLREK